MATTKLSERIKAPPIEQGTAFKVGQYLPLDQIRMDGGTQARAGLDNQTVAEYAESWLTLSHRQNGFLDMPLIIVYHDGKDYWLADGFHRVVAYRQFLDGGSSSASPHAIHAEVRMGTKRDAVLFACGANATHGLRRTNADKRRAVETLLRDDEWKQWSDSEIARRCAVDHKTVASVRAELESTGEIPGSPVRQSADGKARDVTGIQQANESRTQVAPDPPDDLKAAGVALTKHGSWWKATGYSGGMNGWASDKAQPWDLAVAEARAEITKRTADQKPTRPELAPITVQTNQGPREIVPTRVSGDLAWHTSITTGGRYAITHIKSGKQIAQFMYEGRVERAFEQLARLDWSQCAPDGGMSTAMAVDAARILVGFDDVDKFDQRRRALARHEARLDLETRGWTFLPAESPESWIKLTHPDLTYGRQEPTMDAAIKIASELQANYDRRDQLRAADVAQPDPAHVERMEEQIEADRLPEARMELVDDAAMMAQIRSQAGALGLELAWEDGQVMLFWPGEDLNQLMPLSYADALDFLASQPKEPRTENEAAGISAHTAPQLDASTYTNALSLLASIRGCLNASLRSDAAENTRRLLALLEATD